MSAAPLAILKAIKFYDRILKIYKSSVKDIIIVVINCCW